MLNCWFLMFLLNGLLKVTTLVLLALTTRPQFSQYLSSLFREFRSPVGDSDKITRSSAKESELSLRQFISSGWQQESNISWMSLMKMLKRSGLRLHPCLTPMVELMGFENLPLFL